MFVPIHHVPHRKKGDAGKGPQLKPAALAAVAAIAAVTGLVTALIKEATHGDRVAGAIIIVAVSAVAGFVLARTIGRQGRI